MSVKCLCGCGETVKGSNKYIHGHNLRDVKIGFIPHKHGKFDNEEWLRTEYIEKKRSPYDMAKECGGVSSELIYGRLRHAGIKIRSKSESKTGELNPTAKNPEISIFYRRRGYFKGKLHPLYGTQRPPETRKKISDSLTGGLGAGRVRVIEYYWNKIRRALFKSEDYTCALCGNKFPANKLIVHHIIPRRVLNIKKYPPNEILYSPSNLKVLCRGCHNKVEPRRNIAPLEAIGIYTLDRFIGR